MEIAAKAEVYCTDGFFGHVNYIILDPITKKVTHLVVEEDVLTYPERLVPLDLVEECTPYRISINLKKADLRKLESFTRMEFLQSDVPDYMLTMHLMWPYIASHASMKVTERSSVPPDELAVRRGATVMARDGLLGHIDKFIVDADTERVSQLIVREGHLWGQKVLTIPVASIERIEQDTVYLTLSRVEAEHLTGPAPV
jgi:sporulation protein YlmC with PRC-barrel domain